VHRLQIRLIVHN